LKEKHLLGPPSVYFKDADAKNKRVKKLVDDVNYKGNAIDVYNITSSYFYRYFIW